MRRAAGILLMVVGAIASFAALLVVAIWVGLTEPWPLSLRHGPDTELARTVRARVLPQADPVRDVYAREEWGFGGDMIYSLRFRYDDDAVVARIVSQPDWERVGPQLLRHVRYLSGPRWWPLEGRLRGLTEVYVRGAVDALWVDRATKHVYFQRGDWCCVVPKL